MGSFDIATFFLSLCFPTVLHKTLDSYFGSAQKISRAGLFLSQGSGEEVLLRPSSRNP